MMPVFSILAVLEMLVEAATDEAPLEGSGFVLTDRVTVRVGSGISVGWTWIEGCQSGTAAMGMEVSSPCMLSMHPMSAGSSL
jgi:hypothetical protein